MTIRTTIAAALAAILFTATLAAEDAAQLLVRRFALVVGANDGGSGRIKLKFASSDAQTFAGVMREMGGVEVADLVLLLDPGVKAYDEAVAKVRRIAEAGRRDGERRELVFYYSGHSDETGLILGGETVGYERIRADLASVAVDVRVAVLDSCSSGALTRAKGGVQRPAFLFDASADMKGHAFLTSSSAEEAAQESDAIGASFFTHYLVSGMRGAADSTGDRVVTLNEAYHFAFKETLASTERTQFGPQHPAYDINLTGSGDLVLTDLRAASAGLVIPEEISGRLYIRNSRGALTVELAKAAGQRVEFGLEPGTYTVTVDSDGRRSQATVRIAARSTVVLEPTALAPVASSPTRARGNAEGAEGMEGMAAAGRLAADVASVVQDAMEIAKVAVAEAMDSADEALRKAREKSQASRKPEKPEAPEKPAKAEEPREEAKAMATEFVHVSFLPDIIFGARPVTTHRMLSINILFGFGDTVTGADLSSMGSLLMGQMAGLQASGIINFVVGDVAGAQLAGIMNFDQGSVSFLQAAGCVNMVCGSVSGSQLSGIAGVAGATGGSLNGLQASGILSLAKDAVNGVQLSGIAGVDLGGLHGFQASGIASVALGDVDGAQIAGIAGFTPGGVHGLQLSGILGIALGGVNGAQISGIANWTDGAVGGAQVSGIFNRAGALNGPQFGLLNVSGDVAGAQVGLVNIGRNVKGTQIGLVNFSREFDGVPIGLLNIEEKGRQRIEAWWDSDGTVHGALAVGTRLVYTILTAGMVPESAPISWSWGVGFGMRVDLGSLFLEGDITSNNMHTGTDNWLYGGVDRMMPMGRIQLGLPVGDRAAVCAGIALRLTTPFTYRVPGTPEGSDLYLKPSFFCGARL